MSRHPEARHGDRAAQRRPTDDCPNPLWPGPPPTGTPVGATCAGCVWLYRGGRGVPVERCRRHLGKRVAAEAAACPAFTGSLDCQACGACCREAYDTVEVGPRDPFLRGHRELVVEQDGRLQLLRRGGSCTCLTLADDRYGCTTYADRPRTCRDFEAGSENCVTARRRVGLTR